MSFTHRSFKPLLPRSQSSHESPPKIRCSQAHFQTRPRTSIMNRLISDPVSLCQELSNINQRLHSFASKLRPRLKKVQCRGTDTSLITDLSDDEDFQFDERDCKFASTENRNVMKIIKKSGNILEQALELEESPKRNQISEEILSKYRDIQIHNTEITLVNSMTAQEILYSVREKRKKCEKLNDSLVLTPRGLITKEKENKYLMPPIRRKRSKPPLRPIICKTIPKSYNFANYPSPSETKKFLLTYKCNDEVINLV